LPESVTVARPVGGKVSPEGKENPIPPSTTTGVEGGPSAETNAVLPGPAVSTGAVLTTIPEVTGGVKVRIALLAPALIVPVPREIGDVIAMPFAALSPRATV
jgi:hypothetical protein